MNIPWLGLLLPLFSILLLIPLAEAQSGPGSANACDSLSVCWTINADTRMTNRYPQMMAFVRDISSELASSTQGAAFVAMRLHTGFSGSPQVMSAYTTDVTTFNSALSNTPYSIPSFVSVRGARSCDTEFRNRGANQPRVIMMVTGEKVDGFYFDTEKLRNIVGVVTTNRFVTSFFPFLVSDRSLALTYDWDSAREVADAILNKAREQCPGLPPPPPPSPTPSPTSSASPSASPSASASPTPFPVFSPLAPGYPLSVPKYRTLADIPPFETSDPPSENAELVKDSLVFHVYNVLVSLNPTIDVGIGANVSIGTFSSSNNPNTARLSSRMDTTSPISVQCEAGRCSADVTLYSNAGLRQDIIQEALSQLRKQENYNAIYTGKWNQISSKQITEGSGRKSNNRKEYTVKFQFNRKYLAQHVKLNTEKKQKPSIQPRARRTRN